MYEPGLQSLVPPLIAIVLAIGTRTVVVPLLIGVLAGAAMCDLHQVAGDSTPNMLAIFAEVSFASVFGRDHLMALAFSLLLGSMVGVLERGGGMVAVIDRISSRLRRSGGAEHETDQRGRAQRLIAATGMVIFFDDYANTLLVGGTMRTTADRYRISREKLAYLVDSTSAPIAGLSVISTWAAIEMSYMAEGLRSAGIESDSAAFELFLCSIPYRFYPIAALIMVIVVVCSGRDLGAMQAAEQQAWNREPPQKTDSNTQQLDADTVAAATRINPRLHFAAIVPIVLCLLTVLATLLWTGSGGDSSVNQSGSIGGVVLSLMAVFGNGDPYLALVFGGAIGLISAAWLHRLFGNVRWQTIFSGAMAGALQMMPAMIILWLAWAMTDITVRLGTGQYLAAVLSSGLSPIALPSVVFLVAGGVAFSTGTSWGTMGLLTPLAVRLSIEMLGETTGMSASMIVRDPLVLSTSGAVLAGAIFGDHCSPISDTTVLSSRSSGCDHLAHVKTQLPYALSVGLISIVCCTLPASVGFSPYLCCLAACLAIFMVMKLFGRIVH